MPVELWALSYNAEPVKAVTYLVTEGIKNNNNYKPNVVLQMNGSVLV